MKYKILYLSRVFALSVLRLAKLGEGDFKEGIDTCEYRMWNKPNFYLWFCPREIYWAIGLRLSYNHFPA